MKAVVNHSGDLYMDRKMRRFINHRVVIEKICKSGLYYVHLEREPQTKASIAKRNLDFLEDS